MNDQIDHTPATYVIDSRGRFSRLFVTSMSYSSVDQLGYEMARSLAALLPGHPRLHESEPLGAVNLLGPRSAVTLPRTGGGMVRLGPGSGPHLVLFFDTWETEVADLSAQLQALNAYQALAKRKGLPPLVAIDEGKVEASPQALPNLLRSLSHPLTYPVAVDASGRVADGYRVQDSPWLEPSPALAASSSTKISHRVGRPSSSCSRRCTLRLHAQSKDFGKSGLGPTQKGDTSLIALC